MNKRLLSIGKGIAVIGAAATMAISAVPANAQETFSAGIVAFLTGPAAGPFGVPGRQGAELVIEAINAGTMPAPYNAAGFGGAQMEPTYSDESGGNAKQVAEYRNLVEKQNMDVMIGFISSGSCMAIAPVAEELQQLTIMATCGTPRLFEDGNWEYTFRTQGNAVGDSIAAALYVRDHFGDENGFTGINQNYAWGQDSYKFFSAAMEHYSPSIAASDNPQFPKIFAGQYGTEISTLALDEAHLVHTSFWDGDIEAFVIQALVRGFFDDKLVVSVVGASAVDSLGDQFPDGVVMGTRGEVGILVRDAEPGSLNEWFINAYKERYGAYPMGPSYQYARAIIALKVAMDKAAETSDGMPSQEEIMAAMNGMTFQSLAGEVSLALGNGHQAIHPVGYGITKWDSEAGEPGVTDVTFYPNECLYPPAGTLSADWMAAGMPGSTC